MKIDNTAIIAFLTETYKTAQKADCFILGFNIENCVLFAEIPLDIMLSEFAAVSMTSDAIPCKRLRVKPLTKKTQALFNTFAPRFLCSMDTLQKTAKDEYSGNCGQCFESLVCDFYGGEKSRDSAPFWECGDFSKNGIEYQVKFQNATIISEYSAKSALQNV